MKLIFTIILATCYIHAFKKSFKILWKFFNKKNWKVPFLWKWKSPGADKIDFNVINFFLKTVWSFQVLRVFKWSLESGVFSGPNKGCYKDAAFTQFLFFHVCSLKILELVMYSCLYKYSTDKKYCLHNILVSKKATLQNMHLLSL